MSTWHWLPFSFLFCIKLSSHTRLNNTFVQESRSRDVSVQPVDFGNTNEALYIINNWISSATKNHIRNLFKPDHLYGLKVLLTNTMYFRGVWKTIFNDTVHDRFESTDKLNKPVTYMKKTEKLRGSEFESANRVRGTWVELPYEVCCFDGFVGSFIRMKHLVSIREMSFR